VILVKSPFHSGIFPGRGGESRGIPDYAFASKKQSPPPENRRWSVLRFVGQFAQPGARPTLRGGALTEASPIVTASGFSEPAKLGKKAAGGWPAWPFPDSAPLDFRRSGWGGSQRKGTLEEEPRAPKGPQQWEKAAEAFTSSPMCFPAIKQRSPLALKPALGTGTNCGPTGGGIFINFRFFSYLVRSTPSQGGTARPAPGNLRCCVQGVYRVAK